MGIHGLSKLLADNAPTSIKESQIQNYFGRKIAIDASMSLYQFLIAVGSDGTSYSGAPGLTDENGETTSHLQGLFYRTIRMLSHGLKPCFVFDGKPPVLKSGELEKRKEKREKAEEQKKQAEEMGDQETLTKMNKRTARVTSKHNDEAKKLLRLMGVPIIEAPCEAEAQCAAMTKAGLVFATATEDMDSLTLGTPLLLRHLTFSEAKKAPILEIRLAEALEELKMTNDQFIDLCILLGCDYCNTIRGIGPVRALELIRKYGSMEEILKHIDRTKYGVPENFNYQAVRDLFKNPEVTESTQIELKWTPPDEEGLIAYMVGEKGFNRDRIMAGIEKLKKFKKEAVQERLTSYFGVPAVVKRKRDEPETKTKGKKKTCAKASAKPVGKTKKNRR